MSKKFRVRFAPSPTGFLHIGGLRSALYDELFARHHGGDFILRIEDTDQARTVEGGVENICNSLKDAGVIPNEGMWIDDNGKIIERGKHGPYIQSKRQKKHLAYAEKLIKMDKAYYCFCTEERLKDLRAQQTKNEQAPGYDGKCCDLDHKEAEQRVRKGEKHVIRLKFPQKGKITFEDIIRGKVEFDWSVIDDQVIIKTSGMPTYHLASTCDDHDMEISHVLRGEEWLPSTPKHLFIYEAFGWKPPKFAHLPLLLNEDRSKLSKRQGDVSVSEILEKGYLPQALLNFVALLGWNPTADREIYTHDELVELFNLEKVNKAGAVVNYEKFDWLNSHYIKELTDSEYLEKARLFIKTKIRDQEFIDRALLLARDRLVRINDVADEIDYLLKEKFNYKEVSLPWKKQSKKEVIQRLEALLDLVNEFSDKQALDIPKVEKEIKKLIADKEWGNGDTLWPLRVALSGSEKSPGPFELIATYGKERAIARIKDSLTHLKGT
ncbi:MAG: glutamate--tRNA ligase [Patescibacteria group bacterium]|nr:glutamate--tRNA ligase [Patescibacteria group bacterium]MBU2509602.1 glutamate--tRNA ligase [Patescibacteria group bacterium]